MVEGERQHSAAHPDQWPHAMLVPCRSCSIRNNGIEIRKPLKAFTVATKVADFWNVIAKGQDIDCIKCVQAQFWECKSRKKQSRILGDSEVVPETDIDAPGPVTSGHLQKNISMNIMNVMVCDTCHNSAAKTTFSKDMQTAWETNPWTYIECYVCAGGDKQRKRAEYQFITCTTCAREWPETAFITDPQLASKFKTEPILALQNAGKIDLATCAACAVAGTELATRIETCLKCQRQMPLTGPSNNDCDGWAPTKVREFLQVKGSFLWICFDCQHPKCTKCGKRPELPIRGARTIATATGICEDCRSAATKQAASSRICQTCGSSKPQNDFESAQHRICKGCRTQMHRCPGCSTEKMKHEFARPGNQYYIMRECVACSFPSCANCGKTSVTIVPPSQRANGTWYRVFYKMFKPPHVRIERRARVRTVRYRFKDGLT